jgi:hypothetical protein
VKLAPRNKVIKHEPACRWLDAKQLGGVIQMEA